MDKKEKEKRRKQGVLFARAWRKEFGIGVKRDPAKACRIYRDLFEKQEQEPINLLKRYFVDGFGVTPDEAISYVRKSAELHCEESMLLLARCYEEGECVERDMAEAIRLYRHAADIGLCEALFRLGRLYATGTGVGQDMAVAVQLYRKAAAQGYHMAQWHLAECYERGLGGLVADPCQAARYYRWAVQWPCDTQRVIPHFEMWKTSVKTTPDAVARYLKEIPYDNSDAKYCYAVCLETGRGVPRNLPKAAEWYRSAAECGGCYEASELARFYIEHPELALSEEEASFCILNAARLNDGAVFLDLAKRYEHGIGLKRDPFEAAYWYRRECWDEPEVVEGLKRLTCEIGEKAMVPGETPDSNTIMLLHRAEAGYARAQRAIGLDYMDGDGIDQDNDKAFYWLRLASEQGDSCAQYWLSHCYQYGQGTEADFDEAVKWLRLSAAQNETLAQEELAWLLEKGHIQPQNDEEAELCRLRTTPATHP